MGIEGAHGVLVVCGDEDDCGTGIDQFEHLETVEFRHLDVEEEEVGRGLGDRLDGFETVGAFRDDLDLRACSDQFAKKASCQFFVIYYHRAQCTFLNHQRRFIKGVSSRLRYVRK